MTMTFTLLLAAHIVIALLLIAIILLQQGKGATAGAAFGTGASSTVFGSRGSASFLTRTTAILATLFLANSLLLAYLYGQSLEQKSLLEEIATKPVSEFERPVLPTSSEDREEISSEIPPIVD
jgi:preprotein translocase subunit SecG